MKQRQSGVELLRLLAMFGIVLNHWGGHGSYELTTDNDFLFNKVFIQLTEYFGEVGNCVFVMITGFFLANRNTINIKGVMRVVKDVKFYALLIWILVAALGYNEFSITGGVMSLFPIIYSQYWFVMPFLTILVLSPWLNQLLLTFTDNQKKWYFVLLFAIELVLPLVFANTVSSNVGAFILFYSVGVQLRNSPNLKRRLLRFDKLMIISGFGLAVISVLLLDFIVPMLGVNPHMTLHFIDRFSFLPLLSALGLFLFFCNLCFQSPLINKLAQSAFAVYLISENPNVYPWFWKRVFNNIDYIDTYYMVGVSFLQCFFVFATCIMIDMVYKRLLKYVNLNMYGI